MNRQRLIVILLFTFIASGLHAQQYTASAQYGKGLMFGGAGRVLDVKTFGAGLSVSWPAVHEQGHRMPWRMGLMADFTHIPNGIAGERAGLGGFVQSPIARIIPYIPGPSMLPAGELALELCTGFGLYTKPLSYTHDEINHYISTPLNCMIDFGPVYTQPLCNGGAIVAGFKFVHNSNGFFAKPNMGMNFIQGELGWQFDPKVRKGRESRTLSFSEKYDARTSFFLMAAPGFNVPRSVNAHNGELAPAYTIQTGWRCAYQKCRAIELSLDWAYNFSDDYDYRLAGEKTPFPLFVAVAASHVTYWGPLSMRLGVGCHVIESFDCPRIYERAGVYYNFFSKSGRHQFAGIAIKASFVRADYIEWSYGIDLW